MCLDIGVVPHCLSPMRGLFWDPEAAGLTPTLSLGLSQGRSPERKHPACPWVGWTEGKWAPDM